MRKLQILQDNINGCPLERQNAPLAYDLIIGNKDVWALFPALP